MNIITKIKNNVEYAHWRKIRDKALFEMEKHESDKGSTEWKRWAYLELKALRKCDEIPLH